MYVDATKKQSLIQWVLNGGSGVTGSLDNYFRPQMHTGYDRLLEPSKYNCLQQRLAYYAKMRLIW